MRQVDETYYFEITDSLIGRDILIVNRISIGAADVRVSVPLYFLDVLL